MNTVQRTVLSWLGVAVGLAAALVTGAWIYLSRLEHLPGGFRLIAGGLALLSLIMALRCARIARAR